MPTSSSTNDISHEETKAGGSSDSTTITTSENLTAVDNHLYIAAITTMPDRGPVDSVTGLDLSWTLLRAQCAARIHTLTEIWIAQGSPASDGSVTATLSKSAMNAIITVSRYSGVDPSNPIGNIVSANTHGVDGSCEDGTDTETYSFDLPISTEDAMAFAAVSHRQMDHFAGAGFAERIQLHQETEGYTAGLSIVDKDVAPSSVTIEGFFESTLHNTTDWVMIAIELLPAP
jgi:hypothetical protein